MHIIGHLVDKRSRVDNGAEEISGQCCPEGLVITAERRFIGANATVEGARHALDMLADAQVANAHLAQRAIKIGKHPIEEPLAQPIRPRSLRLEAMEVQKRVQTDKLETTVDRVGDAKLREENGSPTLLHHPPISSVGRLPRGTSPMKRPQRQRSQSAKTLTANVSRLNLLPAKWAGARLVSTEARSRDVMFDYRGTAMCRLLVLLAATAGAAAIAGCSPSVEQRGNLPSPDKMSEIHAGSTTKDEVTKILGTPSSVSVFSNDKSWYYISRRTAQTAFFTPDVLDQQVYIVSFDEQGVVKAVDHKELQDGKEISPIARATPAPGRELSFLEQLIGNLGKFNGSGGGGGTGGGGDRGQPGPRPNGGK